MRARPYLLVQGPQRVRERVAVAVLHVHRSAQPHHGQDLDGAANRAADAAGQGAPQGLREHGRGRAGFGGRQAHVERQRLLQQEAQEWDYQGRLHVRGLDVVRRQRGGGGRTPPGRGGAAADDCHEGVEGVDAVEGEASRGTQRWVGVRGSVRAGARSGVPGVRWCGSRRRRKGGGRGARDASTLLRHPTATPHPTPPPSQHHSPPPPRSSFPSSRSPSPQLASCSSKLLDPLLGTSSPRASSPRTSHPRTSSPRSSSPRSSSLSGSSPHTSSHRPPLLLRHARLQRLGA
jgi:hypothetical protein